MLNAMSVNCRQGKDLLFRVQQILHRQPVVHLELDIKLLLLHTQWRRWWWWWSFHATTSDRFGAWYHLTYWWTDIESLDPYFFTLVIFRRFDVVVDCNNWQGVVVQYSAICPSGGLEIPNDFLLRNRRRRPTFFQENASHKIQRKMFGNINSSFILLERCTQTAVGYYFALFLKKN